MLTYDEYRFTFSIIAHKEHVLTAFIRPKLTTSVYERSKFNLIQGLKYWRIEDFDVGAFNKLFKLKFTNPNTSSENQQDDN